MSRQRGFWTTLFGGSGERERFSVEELRHLHGVLLRNQVVTDSNRDTVVEALRSIAELVIW
jgi:protein CLEC16A